MTRKHKENPLYVRSLYATATKSPRTLKRSLSLCVCEREEICRVLLKH